MTKLSNRSGYLILLLGGLTAFGPLSIDMYLPAFPEIAKTFSSPLSGVQLSLASFFLGISLGQILYGPASDRYGRRWPLCIGLLIYMVASLACSIAPNLEMLIEARFFQALGACAGMVITRAVVRDLFDHQEAARVFSLMMLVMGIAPILAPVLGGYVAIEIGWRAIFWILSGLSAIALAAVTVFLPETRKPDPSVQIRKMIPIYFDLLKDREFLGYALSGGLAYSSMFAYITGSPFVFMGHYGISKEAYAWIFGSNAFGLIAVSQLNARLLRKYDLQRLLSIALIILTGLGLTLMIVGVMDAPIWALAPPLFAYISVLAMVFPNATGGALRRQQKRAGMASALFGTLQFTLATLMSALVSYFDNGTLVPMTAVIAAASFLALAIDQNVKKPL